MKQNWHKFVARKERNYMYTSKSHAQTCRYTKYTNMHVFMHPSSLPPSYIYKGGILIDSLAWVAASARQFPLETVPWKKKAAWFGQAHSKIFQQKKAPHSVVSIQKFRLVKSLSTGMSLMKAEEDA